MPEEATQLKTRLEAYRQMLGKLGMRDYQVLLEDTLSVARIVDARLRHCTPHPPSLPVNAYLQI